MTILLSTAVKQKKKKKKQQHKASRKSNTKKCKRVLHVRGQSIQESLDSSMRISFFFEKFSLYVCTLKIFRQNEMHSTRNRERKSFIEFTLIVFRSLAVV